jgi:hypothetical protein
VPVCYPQLVSKSVSIARMQNHRPDGTSDAAEWMSQAPAEVVAMVRAEIAREPTPRALRRALYRAQLAGNDELTRLVAERCEDRNYASGFGKALLQAE